MNFTIAHTDYGYIEERECRTLRQAINHLFDLIEEYGAAKTGHYQIGHAETDSNDITEWKVDFKISAKKASKYLSENAL